MASASTTSARSLFVDSKNRLADRVQVNVNNIASIVRQIQRGSKSHEVNKSDSFLTIVQNPGMSSGMAPLTIYYG